MAAARPSLLTPEKVLFGVLACVLALFVCRAGVLDPVLESTGLPAFVKPLPGLPGAPSQKDIAIVEGYRDPAARVAAVAIPDFWAPGSRNPFAQAYDSLRVVAARVQALIRTSQYQGTAKVTIEYRILPHAVSKFRFLLPPWVRLVRSSGSGVVNPRKPDVRDLGEDGNQYTVRLRSPVRSKYTLTLELAWARKAEDKVLKIPEILLPDATHESGLIAIAASPRLQVTVKKAENVTAVDLEDVPPRLLQQGRFAGYRCVAAFRYTAHPYAIALEVSKKTDIVAIRPTNDPVIKPITQVNIPNNPNAQFTRPPRPSDGGTPKPVREPEPGWKMPVSFMGVARAGGRWCVLLKDKGGAIYRRFEGETILGMAIAKISPTSVILENEEGERFKLKDKLREMHGY